jgi:SAM-dependent methyltransferase
MDLKEVGLLGGDEASHWYYASKALALEQCLDGRQPKQILDVGAGSGFFSKHLLRRTTARSAICVDPGYTEDSSDVQFGKTIAFRRSSEVGDADVVLLMDVLEHVDDDVGLLRSYADPARPGTRFIVSVPAFSWLWSGHDEFLDHRRRYTLKQTMAVLADSGLTPAAGFYFFGALFPVVAAHRLLQRALGGGAQPKSDLRRHHLLTNRMLAGICRIESAVARHNRAFGLTAFGVADKR